MSLRACGHSVLCGNCCAGCYDVLLNQKFDLDKERDKYRSALEKIAKRFWIEGKTGDPLYLLEICQEEAKEALRDVSAKIHIDSGMRCLVRHLSGLSCIKCSCDEWVERDKWDEHVKARNTK